MGPAVRVANAADTRFLAEVMHQSMLPGVGRGIFDDALEATGTGPIDFHEALLRVGANNWGQRESFVVIDDEAGSPAAAMGSFIASGPDRRPLTPEGFKRVSQHLSWSATAGREFWRRYTSFFGMFGNAPQLSHPTDYVLEYAAVRPELQGQGLYARLVDAQAERARAMGFRQLGGTAVFGNDKVVRALEKAGFREEARYGPEYYRGQYPGLIRYVKNI